MDAAMVTAIAALVGAPLAAAAAMYGSRQSGRAQREGGVIGGYNSLTDQLQEERGDLRQQVQDLRRELAAERSAKAALEAECSLLRAQLAALGGAQ
ncbi:hypothetical protein B4N89_02290 [Embleya scabrispora]|uniref:Uncharacterized protein n=1 Tax=Embleya scabrispora TaxID=159449 RepID=A0A1T3NSQ6_9ACTN|nr:hypothetical protein [Embleya scabrispora]OPC79927.1 hypothetical protein B4N89_02290 [Embleya scabrispora]